MEVHRVNLTKPRLAAMPAAERSVLFLLGHASNEINVLSKLILMARKQPHPIQFVDHVEAGQTFILMRLLIGKLHEAWEFFKRRLQADAQIRSRYLLGILVRTLPCPKCLFSSFKASPADPLRIRNKISFHYSDEDDLTEANFQRLPGMEPWEFYLCRTIGNSFYFASELVVQGEVIDFLKSHRDSAMASELSMDTQAFAGLCDTVVLVSGQITNLFGELIASLVATSIGDDIEAVVVDVPDCPKISSFDLPYFFDENDMIRRGR